MKRRPSDRLPSPAIVVAIAALVAALGGAAVAQPVANKALTKKKVKKIADKEIKKKAPGLSVAHAATAETAQDLPDLEFTILTLKNNWVPFGAGTADPAYAVDAQGVVHLRGAINRSSGSSFNPMLLPATIRPAHDVYLVADFANGHTGRLVIHTTGEVIVEGLPPEDGAAFTSLEGLTYSP